MILPLRSSRDFQVVSGGLEEFNGSTGAFKGNRRESTGHFEGFRAIRGDPKLAAIFPPSNCGVHAHSKPKQRGFLAHCYQDYLAVAPQLIRGILKGVAILGHR